jgi:HSP20 family molecular chaperone IbpA
MRYRRSSYRYAVVLAGKQARPWDETRPGDQPGLRFAQTFWRPAADICVSPRGIEVTIDLAGVNQDELDVVLYEDALIVAGQRRLSPSAPDGVYHLAEIPQGPFRLELALPEAIDQDRVEARYDQGLLRITFLKAKAR